jgi:hypothetical protein
MDRIKRLDVLIDEAEADLVPRAEDAHCLADLFVDHHLYDLETHFSGPHEHAAHGTFGLAFLELENLDQFRVGQYAVIHQQVAKGPRIGRKGLEYPSFMKEHAPDVVA